MDMKTYTIQTEASTRSKSRRSMTHVIEATSEADAAFEARMRHVRRCGWNVPVYIESVEVR